jgi:hypothetical protein
METIVQKKNAAQIIKKIQDHSNDPFVKKKSTAAKKTISKYGLPKNLKT